MWKIEELDKIIKRRIKNMENKQVTSETEKRESLKHFMAEKAKAPVCIAFSGGVDSSVRCGEKDGNAGLCGNVSHHAAPGL